MLKRKYRTLVAAVMAGAVLFSPLLCGRPCLEAPVEKTIVAAEAAPTAGEFMGEFAESGVVGCVLTQAVLSIDWSDWADAVKGGLWVWVGFRAAWLIEGNLPQGLPWR